MVNNEPSYQFMESESLKEIKFLLLKFFCTLDITQFCKMLTLIIGLLISFGIYKPGFHQDQKCGF